MSRSANVLMKALAIGALSLTATGASAQAIYVNPYPVVAPEAGYVVRQTIVAPPVLHERTIVVSPPPYVPYVAAARVLPLPRYGYAEERYVVTDW